MIQSCKTVMKLEIFYVSERFDRTYNRKLWPKYGRKEAYGTARCLIDGVFVWNQGPIKIIRARSRTWNLPEDFLLDAFICLLMVVLKILHVIKLQIIICNFYRCLITLNTLYKIYPIQIYIYYPPSLCPPIFFHFHAIIYFFLCILLF